VVVSGVTDALRQIEPGVGREFDFVYVSIDPLDTWQDAAKFRAQEASRYGRGPTFSGWHYFVGPKASITAITQAAGFHFTEDLKNRQYAHPSGFVVLTPSGAISRYFLGVDFSSKDVAEAIRRASMGKTGESVYNLLLVCFRGDQISGRYGVIIWRSLQIAVSLTVFGLAFGIGWMLRQERRASRTPLPSEKGAVR
jgi:protein SCO1/2